jgi:ParB/RepB/Spo0J family partition protein
VKLYYLVPCNSAEGLTPIEEALAYGKLLELHSLKQEALAQRLGIGQSTVANKLRLLKLPQEVQDALSSKANYGTPCPLADVSGYICI